ncbi:MAG TPA: hypothetical protein VJ385_08620 [Fibrobacteria bacterium]|nr:hypothetical protein [Fibrobacteria bacterium]
MTRAKRWLLWGLVLSPVALMPSAFLVSRAWLNHHLQRELALGDFRIRLANPYLGWDLDFHADSVEMDAPRVSLRAGRIATDVRLWNSIASLKPNIRVAAEEVRIRVEPDSLDSLEREKKRRRRKPPSFPNVRIPVAFKVTASRVQLAVGDAETVRIRDLVLLSQGPKGASLEASGIAVRNPRGASLLELDAAYRASARWFGKSLRYQFRAQNAGGDFLRLEGERRKSDLRFGKDSLEAQLAGFSPFAALFPGKGPPDFSAMEVRASARTGETREATVHAAFTTPRVWQIGPQRVEWTGNLADSSGQMVLKAHGFTGEELYLQGHFQVPGLDSGFARVPAALTAALSGYSHDFRFRIGSRILPGDAEIRRLRILPGLNLEAEVRTRDSSVIRGRAFRAPDSASKRDSSWKCTFAGTVDPRETWVHAWVDTNVTFRHARVSGEAGRKGLTVEAWVKQPKAYGAAADSVYAVQIINRTGYYLTGSRVRSRDVIWPVTGQVEWGRRLPAGQALSAGKTGLPGRKRKVSLAFRTKHPRYGFAEYAMPRTRAMIVRAEKLDCRHLPYTRLQKLIALKPVVTGGFEWDWLARTGRMDAGASLAYQGQSLGLEAEADWDARLFRATGLDVSFAGSKLHFSGEARLGGKQFWQMGKLGLKDVQSLSLGAEKFDAASLGVFLGPGYPVERGSLDGRLTYSDTAGFGGQYQVRNLELTPVRKLVSIPSLDLVGQGDSLMVALRTNSAAYPWLNDLIAVHVTQVLGQSPGLSLKAISDDGLNVSFLGRSGDFRDLEGVFSVSGDAALPGQVGTIRDLRLGGHFRAPFGKDVLKGMDLDSGSFAGRYAVPGLDTQSFQGSLSLREGRLRVPDLRASDRGGVTLSGEAEGDLNGAPKVTAKLRGRNLALQWPGVQRLVLSDAEASLRLDSNGLLAQARVGKAEFASSKPPVSMRGSLENLDAEYFRPPAPKGSKGLQAASTPQLKVKAKLRDFLFKHKIGFRELQRSIRTVKTDKRKKRVKPVDLQLTLETAGSGNRIETDVLRMVFVGDVTVKGVYPYTLLSGEFSALNGELGQTSQSYDISDFDLKWQNATVEEGRISVEGGKRLKSDCRPETERTCNVYVKLAGRLDEMAFTYDSDCGGNSGETMEPAALINSVSRGCFSEEYVAGAGGGNYGEAVFALLEPTINEKLTSVGDRFSGGWIKRTSVSGIGTAVSGDTTGAEPIAIGVESKEKWGVSVKAKAGYHPEKKAQNLWENKLAAEWRPPLEKASKSSEWKRRVRDRVTLEASVETRPDEKLNEQNRQDVRKQVGIRYRYKFWNLW